MEQQRVTDPAHAVAERSSRASTVLVVDDDVSVRESLRLLLDEKYRVLTVPNGNSALDLLRDEAVDVVLLDLTMPGLGGVETLAKIRETDEFVEVVVVTGFGSYQTAVDSLRLRAFDYITKPLDADRVLSIVRSAVESRRHRREGPQADRIPNLTRRLLELLDALYLERPAGLGESFFVKLDYLRLLAQSLRDGTGGSTTKIANHLAAEAAELEALVPSGIGGGIGRVLERIRALTTSIQSG
jgi:FixJ family two-component response regulator